MTSRPGRPSVARLELVAASGGGWAGPGPAVLGPSARKRLDHAPRQTCHSVGHLPGLLVVLEAFRRSARRVSARGGARLGGVHWQSTWDRPRTRLGGAFSRSPISSPCCDSAACRSSAGCCSAATTARPPPGSWPCSAAPTGSTATSPAASPGQRARQGARPHRRPDPARHRRDLPARRRARPGGGGLGGAGPGGPDLGSRPGPGRRRCPPHRRSVGRQSGNPGPHGGLPPLHDGHPRPLGPAGADGRMALRCARARPRLVRRRHLRPPGPPGARGALRTAPGRVPGEAVDGWPAARAPPPPAHLQPAQADDADGQPAVDGARRAAASPSTASTTSS